MDNPSNKLIRNVEDLEDRISRLPDEILVFILSFLTFKEAIRTSVLSHRWKYLWQFFTGSLDFEDPDTVRNISAIQDFKAQNKQMRFESQKFVKRVNCILKSHQASTIDEFRVCFELSKRSKLDIDGWVDFAISKSVKRLELNFTPRECIERPYTFPQSSIGVPCLKSLTLMHINVTGELLEQFLSNCPLLERLHVAYSNDLVTLKVYGPSLQLKYLHIARCSHIKSVEIFAPNLESFGFDNGSRVELFVNHAPRLLDLLLGGVIPISHVCRPFSSYFSQLQSLTLDICHASLRGDYEMEFPEFQGLLNLRHLEVRVFANHDGSLLGLISLIEASHVLHKFSLKLSCFVGFKPLKNRELRKVMKCPNEHLKEVEIMGFVGHEIDIELAVYLLESAIKLEKIVIDPRALNLVGTPWEEENKGARDSAEQLKKHLPLGAEFVIL